MGTKRKKKLKIRQKYVWLIAYINPEFIKKVKRQMARFDGITAYIPTVKILSKNFKGKPHYEYIPLLFNYGFFKIPRYMANEELLQKMQENITCIIGWVKDPARRFDVTGASKARKDRMAASPVATASKKEVLALMEHAKEVSIHSSKDLEEVKVGHKVILRGYPFEGLEAKVISIDLAKKKIYVNLGIDGLLKNVLVDFQNVFYSIYNSKGYDDSLGNHLSLDDTKAIKRSQIENIQVNL